MTTLLTSKRPAKERTTLEIEIRPPERKQRPVVRHALRISLLIGLVGGLSILLIVHTILTSILSPIPQPTTCSALLSSADYPQAVGLQPQSQQMAAVQLVNGLARSAPAALVQVTNQAEQNGLDVYVFGCVLRHDQPQLTQLFAQKGLIQGTVELTPEHTLMIKNLDTRISAGLAPFLQPLQQNVYHEYAWRQDSFAQLPFAGFYPVTSQAEADALQQNADGGQNVPWNDPVNTALQMSKDLLQWSPHPKAQLLSHTGDTAVVELTKQSPHIILLVTLKQLIQPDSTGLWFVTDARTRGMLLTQPGALDQPLSTSQSSPIHFGGANALIDGQTSATLFDHTMTPVDHATGIPLTVHPDSSYSGTVSYANLASGQQGVLLIESLPKKENFAKESGQILLTGIMLN